MTHLSLSSPLRSLLDLAREEGRVASQADLGAKRDPPVKQGPVGGAIAQGPAIRLATLEAYAKAAGYDLRLEARDGEQRRAVEIDGRHTLSVAEAQMLLDALGFEMALGVE